MSVRNIGASIRDRLLNKARAEKLDYNLLLTRYALERLLYRLSISVHRDQFLLKGALLFDLWFDVPHRPTHDADFLGFGSAEIPRVDAVFREICRIEVEDGIGFDPDSVKAAEIRKEAHYAGVRVTLMGLLASARCPVQVDIGFGDAVVPGPEEALYPIILGDMSGTASARLPMLFRGRGKAGGADLPRHAEQPNEGFLRPVGPGETFGFRRPGSVAGGCRHLRAAANAIPERGTRRIERRIRHRRPEGNAVAGLPAQERHRPDAAGSGGRRPEGVLAARA